MFACDEISERPPHTFIDGNNGRKLHEMLDRSDGFRIAGMEIQITVADGKSCPAATAHQLARAAEQMFRMI